MIDICTCLYINIPKLHANSFLFLFLFVRLFCIVLIPVRTEKVAALCVFMQLYSPPPPPFLLLLSLLFLQ